MAKHKSSKQSSSYCPIVSDLIDLGAALALDVFSALLRQRESASKHSYRVDPYAAAGIAAGDADKGLDVLSGLNDDGRVYMARYLEEHEIRVEFADTSEPFYIDVRMFGGNGGSARVVMAKNHTNVVLVERDGEILQDTRTEDPSDGENALTELLNVADIIEFADTVDLADVEEVLSRQAEYNYAISCEGLKNDWGGRVGKLYASDAYPNDLLTQAKAAAAAGS